MPQHSLEVEQWPPSAMQEPPESTQVPPWQSADPQQSEEDWQWEPALTQLPSLQTRTELQVSIPQQSELALQWSPRSEQGPEMSGGGEELSSWSSGSQPRSAREKTGISRRRRGIRGMAIV